MRWVASHTPEPTAKVSWIWFGVYHHPFFGVCDTPLHLRMAALIMPLRVTRRYNRGAVTTSITPHWRRRRLCGDTRISPPSTTAARLQTPPNGLWFTWRVMCHQRWQTMLNRGWSASVTCGSRMLYICSASKMSNIIVPLRGTYYTGRTLSAGCAP